MFGGDDGALAESDRCLDAVEADLALARGRVIHARFLAEKAPADGELELFERADALYERLADVRGRGEAQFWIGAYHQVVGGDGGAARPAFERSLELADQAGDLLTASYALRHLGIHDHQAGRLPEARARLEESTRLRRELGFDAGAAANLIGLAYLAAQQERHQDAVELLGEAEELAVGAEAGGVLGWIAGARRDLGIG